MRFRQFFRAVLLLPLLLGLLAAKPANADGNLKKVKHVVVIMQENHSFDMMWSPDRNPWIHDFEITVDIPMSVARLERCPV